MLGHKIPSEVVNKTWHSSPVVVHGEPKAEIGDQPHWQIDYKMPADHFYANRICVRNEKKKQWSQPCNH